VEGAGVQTQEVPGSAPSCCGSSRERDSGQSCLLEMALGLGRVPAEVSLPSGGQEWTSLRGAWECVSAESNPVRREDDRNEGGVQNPPDAHNKYILLFFYTTVVVRAQIIEKTELHNQLSSDNGSSDLSYYYFFYK